MKTREGQGNNVWGLTTYNRGRGVRVPGSQHPVAPTGLQGPHMASAPPAASMAPQNKMYKTDKQYKQDNMFNY